jgi:hypothetical protein
VRCADAGAAIASTATIATPLKRCFISFDPLLQFKIGEQAPNTLFDAGLAPQRLTTQRLNPFPRSNNMAASALFQALE